MRQKKRQDWIYSQRYREAVSKICSCRIDYAVGEVEETDGFIDYRKAEGDQGIYTACDNAV